MSESSDEVPSGLVFPSLQDGTRRSSLWAFLLVTLITGLALIWPFYPVAADAQPYVLGLPLSFAWVVGWLILMFVALVLFYRVDEPDEDRPAG